MYRKWLLLVIFLVMYGGSPGQELAFLENDSAVVLLEDGKPRFSYEVKSTGWKDMEYARANYIHPLYDLDGTVLTADFPPDHPHHRGIFWTWHQLMLHDRRIADPWYTDGIVWVVENVKFQVEGNLATITAEVLWIPLKTGSGEALFREDLTIRYQRMRDMYFLDIDIGLTPLLKGLKLGGSEDSKGYGGFAVRLDHGPLKFFDEQGPVTALEEVSVDTDWVGIENISPNSTSAMIIMTDRSLLPSFKGWILRTEKSMQNPAFPGRYPLRLVQGRTILMRQRLVVSERVPDLRVIHAIFNDFLER